MSAKLFNPAAKNLYVWAVFAKDDKSRPPATVYVTDDSPTWEGVSSEIARSYCLASDGYPMGRYDEFGYYCTHCPPIPGAEGKLGLSRYIRHPLATKDS